MSFCDSEITIRDLVDVVITVLNARDPYTYAHSQRVAQLSVMIAEKMELSKNQVRKIRVAASLHDIGKIGVPDIVLNKPGRLSLAEKIQMQAHSRIGYNILIRLPLLQDISNIVLYHHERCDGLGYPVGLPCKKIPLESRIIAVADTFDAITSERPYRKRVDYEEGVKEINKHSGSQFCSVVVQYFNAIRDYIPETLEYIEKTQVNHAAFVDHYEFMHSRKLIRR